MNIILLIIVAFFYTFAELNRVITSEVLLAIVGIISILISISAFIMSIKAITKDKERSVLIIMPIVIGLLTLFFIFGDMFS